MKRLYRPLLFLLALAAALSLASCSAGDTVMRYGEQELLESDYAYLMATVKEYYDYYAQYYYGSTLDSIWDTAAGDGVTFADALTETVRNSGKMMLIVEQLCAEAGLTIDDAETLAEIDEYMQGLSDDYGGADAMEIELAKIGVTPDAVERYERYNQLFTLLRDYRYGENGVARLSREEVRQNFLSTYAKAEGYLFSYLASDGSSSGRAPYQYDFASDYAKADVEAFLLSDFYCVDYLRYTDEEAAKSAYRALTDGSETFESLVSAGKAASTAQDSYVTAGEFSETLFDGLNAVDEGAWYLSGGEGTDGSSYYVICRKPVSASALTEGENAEKVDAKVRAAMVTRDAKAYFDENYITVRHILYTDETKAKEVYDALQAGTTTFAEHEGETADSGVQYTFTHGSMVEEFDEAAYGISVGQYALAQSDYGWHVITRLELDGSAFTEADVTAAMSREKLQAEADRVYADLQNGAAFAKPADGALYDYSEPTVLELSQQDETFREALLDAADGELVRIEVPGYGIYLLRKHELTDDDLDENYSEVEDPLVDTAIYDYLESFFDAVRVDSAVEGRFDIRTAKTMTR